MELCGLYKNVNYENSSDIKRDRKSRSIDNISKLLGSGTVTKMGTKQK